jgi:hypothetical protein
VTSRRCRHRVVGLMHTRGLCLEVLACGHTAYPLPRRASHRVCRKCQRGSGDYDCDPKDYTASRHLADHERDPDGPEPDAGDED